MDNDAQQIELSIDAAKEMVEAGKRAERLANNPDFKKLVLDGYFVEEMARLAHLAYDPNAEASVRAAAQNDLPGPAAFKRYMSVKVQMGRLAEREIAEGEEELELIRAEEAGDNS